MKFIFLFLLVSSQVVFAGKLLDVELADSITIEGKKLTLNGMGLRKVSRFGIPIKVYVAGLYLQEKAQDADAILNSEGIKQIHAVFLRRVDREKMQEAMKKGMFNNCFADCEGSKAKVREFNEFMVDTKDKGTMIITFFKDRVDIEMVGRKTKKGTVKGEAFSKDLLAVFIGKSPPGEKFKEGLLGVSKAD